VIVVVAAAASASAARASAARASAVRASAVRASAVRESAARAQASGLSATRAAATGGAPTLTGATLGATLGGAGAGGDTAAAHPDSAGPQDAAILGDLATFDDAEIAAATYGSTRGTDPRVVHYAQALVIVHERHLAHVRAVARLLHVSPTTAPDSATRELNRRIDALGSLQRGTAFDSAFVHGAIVAYRHAIGRALNMATDAESDSVRRLVERTVPMFHRNLDSALALQH
jgi:predicted outer membrane protein